MKYYYWGLVFFFLMLIQVKAEDGFMRTRGAQLMLNGAPFYANGFNSYWLMYMGANPSMKNKVSSAFQQAKDHGLSMARTWAFSDGGDSPLQYSPGSYNEQMFQGLDFGQSISSDDEFFTNSVVKGYYKNHIKTVLTRRNSMTGVAYKDEPTIMAWELMNEPRCNSDPSGKTIQAWITEMASYVKSIDGNHLLEIGLEGFYGPSSSEKQQYNLNFQVGTDFIANNQIPGIDFATVHSYPDQWIPNSSEESQMSFLNSWLSNHIQDAQNILKKPILLAEFGKSLKTSSANQRDKLYDTVYSAIYSSAKGGGAAVGGMFWQLFTEGMDNFRDGYEVIFSENPSTGSLITEQSQKINHIRKMYVRLRNIEKWKRARDVRRAEAGNSGYNTGN
ncbi:hypothetical protein LWI28_000009 [Acer negundo]|uniref:mannan endo-1,4-beta-mannosidase n=1 Tax=Acer negundo TaxID=4023 RepID=A0AAD5P557_ACENE|nr:hypothetical protein LWI28_000009 [Acer negundo]